MIMFIFLVAMFWTTAALAEQLDLAREPLPEGRPVFELIRGDKA